MAELGVTRRVPSDVVGTLDHMGITSSMAQRPLRRRAMLRKDTVQTSMHPTHLKLPLALLLALLCVSPTLALVAFHSSSVQAASGATGATPSPYIWGTNLSLYDQYDFFLTRTDTGEFARRIHVQIVRVPDRGNLGLVEATATRIKALGMVPLFVLRYGSANLAHDQQLIQHMNRLFGTGTIYYEYGNEMDLARNGAISKEAYTASWNSVVSRLKPFAPHGKFVGPVTYQANPQYVGYFVQHANPRPDAVSWHEYTCGTRDSDPVCLSHLDNWTKHIQATRLAMGHDLPIMITEYNWNANPDANKQQGTAADPRAHNATFLQQWTRQAIGMLVQNRVFAANQYVLTNNASLAMIDDRTHTLTGTGLAFQSTYEQDHPATSRPTPTATGTASSSHLLCVQGQMQSTTDQSSTLPLWFCVQVGAMMRTAKPGATAGTLCLSLSLPQTPTPTTKGTSSHAETMLCFPVKETITELPAQS